MPGGRPKLPHYREWTGGSLSRKPPEGPCEEWQGQRDHHGYGRVRGPSKDGRLRAHRVAWERVYGPIPQGLEVLHRCDNPPCCRVEHLFLGTRRDNHQDKVNKGRQAKGEAHPLTKLTEEQAVFAMARLLIGETGISIANQFGVDKTTIEHLWRGDTWRWLFIDDNSTTNTEKENPNNES